MKIIYALTIVGVCAWAMGCGGDATYNTYVIQEGTVATQKNDASVSKEVGGDVALNGDSGVDSGIDSHASFDSRNDALARIDSSGDGVADVNVTVSLGEDAMAIRARGNIQMVMGNHVSQQALNYTLDSAGQSTVQIGISQTPAAQAANGPPNLRALISWMTSGVSVDRIVSVGGGTSISGSSEAVSVSLIDETTPTVLADADYQVTVAAVPGSRPSSSAPPTLVPLSSDATVVSGTVVIKEGSYNLATDAVVAIAVPVDAGVQSLYVGTGVDQTTGLVPSIQVKQFDSGGIALAGYIASSSTGFVPLNPLCNFVTLSNAGANNVNWVSLTWGIDG